MKPTTLWPVEGPARDPWPGALDDADAGRAVRAVLTGELGLDEARAVHPARFAPLEGDARAFPVPDAVAPLEDLARMATDIEPDTAGWPDLLVGPWADTLDARLHRRVLLAAAAATAFAWLPGIEQRALVAFCRRDPPPEPAVRARFRAVDHAPWSVWAIEAMDGDQWRVRDRLGLDARWQPTGAVRVEAPGAVAAGPPRTLLARVVPLEDGGSVAALPLVVPGEPSDGQLAAWLALEAAEARRDHPDITREELLRRRGHVLVRRVHEWAWACETSRAMRRGAPPGARSGP